MTLGDRHYTDPALADLAARSHRLLITIKRGAYPHTDDGLEVRRIFHQLRSHAIENFNSQFKSILNCLGQVPTRGLRATTRYMLGTFLLYLLTLWHHQRMARDLLRPKSGLRRRWSPCSCWPRASTSPANSLAIWAIERPTRRRLRVVA